jgi:hypothetical protein
MFKIMNADLTPLESKIPGFPEPLARVVARALAREPSKRYPTVRELSLALAPFRRGGRASASGELDGAETRPIEVARRAAPSRRFYAVLGGTAAASFVLGWSLRPARVQVEPARPAVVTASAAPAPTISALPASSRARAVVASTPPPVSLSPTSSASSVRSVKTPPAVPRRKPAIEAKKEPAPSSGLPDLDPSPYGTSP